MELAGEKQNREQTDKEEPGLFSTHVINKTKLREERLSGQAFALSGARTVNLSAFALEVRPLARLDKTSPVEGVVAAFALQHGELSLTQSFSATQAVL
jgi:hypothetical protein